MSTSLATPLRLLALVLAVFGVAACSGGDAGSDYDTDYDHDDDVDFASTEEQELKSGVSGKEFKCPGHAGIDCTCTTSLFNCELPNTQKGRNRFLTPTGGATWALTPGTELRDGAGNVRGIVPEAAVMINYGQRKTLRGQSGVPTPHVYAFAVDNYTKSGWIEEGRLAVHVLDMPTVHTRNPNSKTKVDYVVRPGVAGWLQGKNYKVVPGSTAANEAATDYVDRGGVVNLLYALPRAGGVSNDTIPVGSTFVRSADVEALYIPLYDFGVKKTNGKKLRFVYGHINGRFGWIAYDALKRK